MSEVVREVYFDYKVKIGAADISKIWTVREKIFD